MKIISDELGEQSCGFNCHQPQLVVQPFSMIPSKALESSAPKTNPKSDKVVLSPLAQELKQAMQWLEQIPDIRLETVNTLRQKIAVGDYYPDEKIIATNMIGEALANQLSII